MPDKKLTVKVHCADCGEPLTVQRIGVSPDGELVIEAHYCLDCLADTAQSTSIRKIQEACELLNQAMEELDGPPLKKVTHHE